MAMLSNRQCMPKGEEVIAMAPAVHLYRAYVRNLYQAQNRANECALFVRRAEFSV